MSEGARPYCIRPVSDTDFVAEVKNIALSDESALSSQAVQHIQEDILKDKILVFKDQGVISPGRQIQISEHFGEIEEAGFEQHEKSPDRKILRCSCLNTR